MDVIVGTHLHVQPTEKRKQPRIAIVDSASALLDFPDKQTPVIEKTRNVLPDKDIAVHQDKAIRKQTEQTVYGFRVFRTRPSVLGRSPSRITGKEFVEIQQLSPRVVEDKHSVHLAERNGIGIVEHGNPAIRSMLPYTPYGGPRQFRRVEMNDANILLHKKKGRDYSRPTLILCITHSTYD